MVENRQVMALNIKNQMNKKGVTAAEICDTLGFKHNTFSDWVNGKSYPRIDKIEKMANYFGISKSELVEEQSLIKKIEANEEKLFEEITNMDVDTRKELIARLLMYEADILKDGD